MPKPKGQRDFLTTCMNSMNVEGTVQEFQQAFCAMCVNPECTRSKWADSQWIKRMLEQEKVLNNPTILDPSGNSEFQKIASQDFISITDEDVSFYGGWVDVKENGKVVHHAEPETENKSSEKVEQSLTSLKNKGVDPSSRTDPSEDHIPAAGANDDKDKDDEYVEEDLDEDEDEPSQFQAPSPTEPKKKPRRKGKKPGNTPTPQQGVILESSNQSPFNQRNSQPTKSSLLTQDDPWEVPDPTKKKKGGKLKVRIKDGKVVGD